MGKLRPSVLPTIFQDRWVRVFDDQGFTEYFCSGCIADPGGDTFYIMHSAHGVKTLGNPYFVSVQVPARVQFVVPQPPAPEFQDLFHNDVPFFLDVKRKK